MLSFSLRRTLCWNWHVSGVRKHVHFLKNFQVSVPWLKKILWVIGVLRRTVVSDWRFDNLCGSHLQSQVIVLVSWKFKNPGERFDWSINRVAVDKRVIWLAVKTCAEIGYANKCKMNNINNVTRQSTTTVLLWTPISQMIFFNQGMLLLGSNHFPRSQSFCYTYRASEKHNK